MSADLSIDRIAPAAALPVTADPAPAPASTTQAEPTKSPNLPNPLFTVDPSLNRVVLEFFSSTGVLTNTLPSQSQLDAYRLAAVRSQGGDTVGGASGS